jgi:hypothetical protein
MVRGGGDKTEGGTQVLLREVQKAGTDLPVRTETLFDFRCLSCKMETT